MEFTRRKNPYQYPFQTFSNGNVRDVAKSRMNGGLVMDAGRLSWSREETRTGTRSKVSHRHPVMETGKKKIEPFSQEGLRWDIGTLLLTGLAVLLAILLLISASTLIETSRRVGDLQQEVDRVLASNQTMSLDLERRTDDSRVGYEAVSMGLISSRGEKPIRLTVPQEAVLTTSATGSGM